MNLLKNLKENWRDILLGLGLAFLFAIIVDIAENISTRQDGMSWLVNTVAMLSGISKFMAATMTAWVGISIVSPELNAFMVSKDYDAGWYAMPNGQKFLLFTGFLSVLIISAAICFS